MNTFNLNSPYPLNESFKDRTVKCAVFGLFVFAFLFVFRPFEMGGLNNYLLIVSLGYGIVCFGMMFLLNVVLFNYMPDYFSEIKWTIKRELFWSVINLLCIGSANFIYSYFLDITILNIGSFLMFMTYTLAVGIFPITIAVILNYSRWNRKFQAESEALNPILESAADTTAAIEEPKVMFFAENGSPELEIMSANFLYAKADDNYVELYYLNTENIKRKVIRNSLKAIHSFLPTSNNFYRCHKSYVINLDHVNHISGNAQGYKFHLKYGEDLIPVSRANNEFVKNYFTNRPKNNQIGSKSM